MTLEQDLEAAEAAHEASVAALSDKVDHLISIVQATKGELAALKATGGATGPELQALIDKINSNTASTQAAAAKADAEIAADTAVAATQTANAMPANTPAAAAAKADAQSAAATQTADAAAQNADAAQQVAQAAAGQTS